MAPVNNELCAIEVSGRSSSFALFPVARRGSLSRKKRKKLLCPLVNAQRSKVSFLCGVLDRVYDLILPAESALRVLHRCPVHSQGPSAPRRSGTVPELWRPLLYRWVQWTCGPPGISESSLLSALLMTCSYSPGWSMANSPLNFSPHYNDRTSDAPPT